MSLETKQICAKALLNLLTDVTLPALIEVRQRRRIQNRRAPITEISVLLFFPSTNVRSTSSIDLPHSTLEVFKPVSTDPQVYMSDITL